MPRPATLAVIDWKAVFESGLEYSAWLAVAESPELPGRHKLAGVLFSGLIFLAPNAFAGKRQGYTKW